MSPRHLLLALAPAILCSLASATDPSVIDGNAGGVATGPTEAQLKGCTLIPGTGKYECKMLPGCINTTETQDGFEYCNAAIQRGHFYPEGLHMTHDRLTLNLTAFFVGIGLFAICFFIMHDRPFGLTGFGLFPRLYPEAWDKLDFAQKGDMASRLHSSLHAVVCWGHIWGFSSCGIWGDMLANDCAINEFFFGLTAGYFVFDFVLVCHYRMAFWQVFIIHHTCAFLPYFIDIFIYSETHFLLGLFIQVETATLILNYQNLLEARELTHTTTYKAVFYTGYVSWFFTRGVMPIYIAHAMMTEVEAVYHGYWSAAICYACAFFVVVFCNVVFFFLLTPDVIAHCRGPRQGELLAPDDIELDAMEGPGGRRMTVGQSTTARRSVWTAADDGDGDGEGGKVAQFRSRASTIRV